jgi:hypothetical protein
MLSHLFPEAQLDANRNESFRWRRTSTFVFALTTIGMVWTTFPTFKSPKAVSNLLSKVKCHNCGGSHYLRDCTEPFDQGRIHTNKKRMSAVSKIAKKEEKGKDSKANNGHLPSGKIPVKPEKG